VKRSFDDLVSTLDGGRSAVITGRLAEHAIEIEVSRWLAYRVSWMQDEGLVPTYEASVSKAFSTEVAQRLANTAVNTLGPRGLLSLDSPGAPIDGLASFTYLLTQHWTISAGTNEIQRNVIAQRGLGLPRD
jgi:alkylation response protein AidB-like acyl-CoA dehydrogenase